MDLDFNFVTPKPTKELTQEVQQAILNILNRGNYAQIKQIKNQLIVYECTEKPKNSQAKF